MNDEHVVALVQVAGRAGLSADVVGRLVEVSEPDLIASAVAVAAEPGVRVVLVHDPLRIAAPPGVVARVVESVLASGRAVVPVLPCSDTVKSLDDTDVVIDTPDRIALRVLQSPIGYPAELISSGAVVPGRVPSGALTIDGGPA
jgi:2-C-methyl-D-erythritol 4-phosphate cytidylyltransferase